MKLSNIFSVSALAFAITACGGGDVNIDAQNNSTEDNSQSAGGDLIVGGGGQGAVNPCAQFAVGGVAKQGAFDASTNNCTYSTDFVGLTNPITQTESQVTFSSLESGGVHIFEDSLVVGRNYDNDADMMAAGIMEGGDGAIIRVGAGATLAFLSNEDYMVVNRGSQIFAEGTATSPITITSVSDAVDGTVGAEDVSEWGGIIINGFGVTNKCDYTGVRGDVGFSTSDCHVAAEGKAGSAQTHYGGDNDADNSGVLEYVVVKHTGAEVAEGNELNGISFDAVGSGTTVDYLQMYSTFDDGIEMFGGAVNISHYVGVYVRDDSIDIDEGYVGTIDWALVVQSENDGNHCIESDGIGSYSSKDQTVIDDFIARGLNSAATIKNLTCIVSPNETGTHDPGAGWRIREAHFPTIENALVVTSYAADGIADDDDGNYCVRIANEGLQAADDGELTINASIFACQDLTKEGPLPSGTTTQAFLEATNDVMQTAEAGENPTASSDANIVVLDGFYSLPLGDMVVNGGAATVVPTDSRPIVGGVSADDDWTLGWTFGLHDTNRSQPLWFE